MTLHSGSKVQFPRGRQTAKRAVHPQPKKQTHAGGNYKRTDSD